MATKTEEVRTRFTWDTKGVKEGGRDIKAGFNNLLQGERRVRTNLTQLVQGFAGAASGASSVAGGIDNLAMTMKLGMGSLVGIAVATKAFSTITEIAQDRADSFQKTMEAVSGSEIAGKYTTASSGVEVLTKALEDQKKTAEQAEETIAKFNDNTGMPLADMITKGKNKLYDSLAPEGSKSKDMQNAAEIAQGQALENQKRIRGEIAGAARKDLDITEMKLRGDERGAKFAELELNKTKQLEKIKSDGLGAMSERTAIVNEEYDKQVEALKIQNRLVDDLLEKQGLISDIENSNLSTKQKATKIKREETAADLLKLQAMNAKGQTAENSPEAAALSEKIRAEGNANHKAEVEGYGSQRSMNQQIIASRRRERRYGRKEDKFNRNGGLMNAKRDMNGNVIGGIDPMTGKSVTRKAPSGLDKLGGGASMGSIGTMLDIRPRGVTSGVSGASMADDDAFTNHFAPKSEQKKPEAGPDVKLLEEGNGYLKIIAGKEGLN